MQLFATICNITQESEKCRGKLWEFDIIHTIFIQNTNPVIISLIIYIIRRLPTQNKVKENKVSTDVSFLTL